ncbi:transposase [Sulfurimonas sp.]|nr:transposase [Sulfurimonas sp.]
MFSKSRLLSKHKYSPFPTSLIFGTPFSAVSKKEVKVPKPTLCATYEDSKPRLAMFLMDNLYDSCTYLTFPKTHRRKLHSTNVLERFNKEIKRRTKVIGAFPNKWSILVPFAIDTNAKWLERNYVPFDNLAQCQKAEDEFTEIF